MTGTEREKWIRRNSYYYKCLAMYLKYIIPEGSSIVEIGCGTGYLLEKLNPARGVGIDINPDYIEYSTSLRNSFTYHVMSAEQIMIEETFDYVLISDTIGSFFDVQKVFEQIQKLCNPDTRIVITSINFLWLPILNLAEKLGLKMPQVRQNWLDSGDIVNLLKLANFDVIDNYKKIMFPKYVPVISTILNKYIGNLPLFNPKNSIANPKFLINF